MQYDKFYNTITKPFRKNETWIRVIRFMNQYLTYMFYILYPISLFFLFQKFGIDALENLVVPALSFILLTIFRHFINRSRPYQTYDIQPIIEKDKEGDSFPSRHVFSAFLVSMVVLRVNITLGILCIVMSCLLGILRVIGGVHYPSDVIGGAVFGILNGLILFL